MWRRILPGRDPPELAALHLGLLVGSAGTLAAQIHGMTSSKHSVPDVFAFDGSASDVSQRRSVNRRGSGQPDGFATRGRCQKRLREHFHRRLPIFCSSLLAILMRRCSELFEDSVVRVGAGS